MTTGADFTLADAAHLRRHRQGITLHNADEIGHASEPLQGYLQHYGFHKLLTAGTPLNYSLTFEAWAGYRIAHHTWQLTDAPAKGTVIVVHGLFDHAGLFLPLVERLLQERYHVVAFDLPGHGLSDGNPATIAAFAEYSAVFEQCLAACQTLPGPYYAIGQSTGCSAIADFLFTRELNHRASTLEKTVLLAPLVRARAWWRISVLHRLFGRLLRKVPRDFGANSHDPAFLHFLEYDDPLQARHVSTAWVKAMRNWEKDFAHAPTVAANVLLIQGTSDSTVDWRWNIPHLQQHFPDARVHYVEGAHHHLVGEAEPWRRDVFETLCQYLAAGS